MINRKMLISYVTKLRVIRMSPSYTSKLKIGSIVTFKNLIVRYGGWIEVCEPDLNDFYGAPYELDCFEIYSPYNINEIISELDRLEKELC